MVTVDGTPRWSDHVCNGWHKYYNWAKPVPVLIGFAFKGKMTLNTKPEIYK